MLLKVGSKGEEVKQLQAKLGLLAFHKTKEYQEIIKLKLELVKYFEWCYEKFGIKCLEDMHYSFDDYCYFIQKHISNPLRFCELSIKIPWIN